MALFAVDITWVVFTDFQVSVSAWPMVGGTCCALAAVAWIYTALRPSAEIAHMCLATLYMILLTSAVAMFSYLLTSLNYPLLDAAYADADRLLGFDWLGFLAWTNDRPLLGYALTLSYHSSLAPVAVLVVLLALTSRFAQLNEFLGLFLVTISVVIVLAGLFPAAGAYVHYNPAPELFANLNPSAGLWHLEQFTGLRDGSLRHVDLSNAEGLVTFPSFHTCLAIIVTWATRDFRWVFAATAILNGAVIVSTLPEGGHHLVDVFAGAIIAAIGIAALRAGPVFGRAPKTEQPAVSTA
ncbi:MAG: phosphatase PAP2 family protein [Hyphomicrobiales bacterium]